MQTIMDTGDITTCLQFATCFMPTVHMPRGTFTRICVSGRPPAYLSLTAACLPAGLTPHSWRWTSNSKLQAGGSVTCFHDGLQESPVLGACGISDVLEPQSELHQPGLSRLQANAARATRSGCLSETNTQEKTGTDAGGEPKKQTACETSKG